MVKLFPAKQAICICIGGGADKVVSFSVHTCFLLSYTKESAGAVTVFFQNNRFSLEGGFAVVSFNLVHEQAQEFLPVSSG